MYSRMMSRSPSMASRISSFMMAKSGFLHAVTQSCHAFPPAPLATTPTLVSTMTTRSAITTLPLDCGVGHCSEIRHLVAEEVLRPVRDVAVLIDLQLLDGRVPALDVA